MEHATEKTSADLQREIDRDRQRIGDRIEAIQERMSPGQLMDEVIAYAKGSGGGEYVSNLGHAIKANPLPVALMGVSLAWLIAKGTSSSSTGTSGSPVEADYPLYPVDGAVRRLGPPELDNGARYSQFGDSSGKRLKALTDEAGHRAGHFVDEAGKTYRGFADASGRQIDQIADETGAMLDTASGWAAQQWEQAKSAVSTIGARVAGTANSFADRSSSTAASLQEQSGRLNEAILTHFRDQPLVGGALAFAVGAAIGAALPHTVAEDDLLGEAADSTKERLSVQASDMIERGKDVASDLYDKTAKVAADSHDSVKERVVEEVHAFKDSLND